MHQKGMPSRGLPSWSHHILSRGHFSKMAVMILLMGDLV